MRLSEDLDRDAPRLALDTNGRASLPGLLDQDSLTRLLAQVSEVPNWNLVTRLGGRHLDLDAAAMRVLPQAQRDEFHNRVLDVASKEFQYLFENYPIYDKAHGGVLEREAPVLAELFAFLNGEAFLGTMRQVLDAPQISFADAQLTCFREGHFLSTHDDGVEGKNRVAAYVLSLSDDWGSDWGGQLEFYDTAGEVVHTILPRQNMLSLFKVPQPHAVMPVLPAAKHSRISVTGWLRAGEDPGPG
jgi:SM-20-related protein